MAVAVVVVVAAAAAVAVAAAAAVAGRVIWPRGIEVEKQGFRTARAITGQMFQAGGLKLKAFIQTVRDLASHLYQQIMRVAV